MQLPLSQLSAQLQKGLRPLYVLHGDEPLLQQEAQDAIRAAARAAGYTERSSFTVAGAHFDWSAVLAAGGSLSLFADRQIVEIRIPSGNFTRQGPAWPACSQRRRTSPLPSGFGPKAVSSTPRRDSSSPVRSGGRRPASPSA